MKKTFISPVAQFVATEAQLVIATSNIETPSNAAGGNEESGKYSAKARVNASTNASNPINVEALDF